MILSWAFALFEVFSLSVRPEGGEVLSESLDILDATAGLPLPSAHLSPVAARRAARLVSPTDAVHRRLLASPLQVPKATRPAYFEMLYLNAVKVRAHAQLPRVLLTRV